MTFDFCAIRILTYLFTYLLINVSQLTLVSVIMRVLLCFMLQSITAEESSGYYAVEVCLLSHPFMIDLRR